jgi:lipopolysaccharide export system protein LptA
MFRRLVPAMAVPVALLFWAIAVPAIGADQKTPSSPFQGFSSDNGNPVNIQAESLETHNNEHFAIFTGSVVATQGDSVLTSIMLTVYYEPNDAEATKTASAATPDSSAVQGGNRVKQMVANGHVVVTAKDQKATGDDGVLDMETNIATMTGQEVAMSQGCNVVKGTKLVVNTKTGLANVTGGTTGRFISGDQKC